MADQGEDLAPFSPPPPPAPAAAASFASASSPTPLRPPPPSGRAIVDAVYGGVRPVYLGDDGRLYLRENPAVAAPTPVVHYHGQKHPVAVRSSLPVIADCGLFGRLPFEMVTLIFGYVGLDDVGNFSLASSATKRLVEEYMTSRACLARVPNLIGQIDRGLSLSASRVQQAIAGDSTPDAFSAPLAKMRQFSVLCKRVTSLQPTELRIQFCFRMLDAVTRKRGESDAERRADDWETTLYVIQFFYMLHIFTKGWEESEYPAVLRHVVQHFQLRSPLDAFLTCADRDSLCVSVEMRLRLVLRCLTWDVNGNDYSRKAAWLLCVLRGFVGDNPRKQAMMFYLLFGPACQDSDSHYENGLEGASAFAKKVMNELNNHADWESFLEDKPNDFYEGKEVFYMLAQAVCTVIAHDEDWKNAMMPGVVDSIISEPERWYDQNVAGFLLFCSEKLILAYLRNKLACVCSYREVGTLLVHMVIVSYRFQNPLDDSKGIGKIMDTYLEPKILRPKLHDAIVQAWKDELNYITDFIDLDEVEEMNEVVNQFFRYMMKGASSVRKDMAEEPARKAQKLLAKEEEKETEDIDIEE